MNAMTKRVRCGLLILAGMLFYGVWALPTDWIGNVILRHDWLLRWFYMVIVVPSILMVIAAITPSKVYRVVHRATKDITPSAH